MAIKLNVNIRTLLSNCEELSKDGANFWRLKKFIKSLEIMIEELRSFDDQSSSEKIVDYTKRLEALKSLINVNDGPPSGSNMDRADSAGDDAVMEMRQLQNSKRYTDLRKELMNEDNLRRRKFEDGSAGNMGEAVKYYSDAQEKITEHMLSLTRNLKEQTETANRIIRKDTEVVAKSAGMTDCNINSLSKETEKLEDHSRNAWKCWMWIMIVFVIIVFVGMVLFMKIMKKRQS